MGKSLFINLSNYLDNYPGSIFIIIFIILSIINIIDEDYSVVLVWGFIFLGVGLFLNTIKSTSIKVIQDLYLLIILYIAICAYFLLFIIDNYYSVGLNYDLDVFSNMFWTTTQGRLFYSKWLGGSQLRAHFSPFLIFLLPIFYLFPFPLTLLVLQTLFANVSIFPVYYITKNRVQDKLISFLIVLIFIFYPPFHGALYWGFHEITFVIPIILFVILSINSSSIRYYPLLFLALSVKENVALVFIFFGIYLFIKGMKLRGLVTSMISVFYFILAIYVIQLFAGGTPTTYGPRYLDFGTSLHEIIFAAIRKPIYTLKYIFVEPKLAYLSDLYFPLLFIPLICFWSTLISFPILMQNLLSSVPLQYSILSQYSSEIIPFFFLGIISLLKKKYIQKNIFKNIYNMILAVILSICIFSLSQKVIHWFEVIRHNGCKEKYRELVRIKKSIGPGGVLRTWSIGAYLYDRMEIAGPDMRFLDKGINYIVLDKANESGENCESVVFKAKEEGFRVVEDGEYFILLERGDVKENK